MKVISFGCHESCEYTGTTFVFVAPLQQKLEKSCTSHCQGIHVKCQVESVNIQSRVSRVVPLESWGSGDYASATPVLLALLWREVARPYFSTVHLDDMPSVVCRVIYKSINQFSG